MTEEEFRKETEQVLHEYSEVGAVILGRAAAVVLRDEPGALHVRLDGPPDRRIGQAMVVNGVDRPTAVQELKIADQARETYVERWYGVDPHDPRNYDLVIDSTRINVDGCVELIALAATKRTRRPTVESTQDNIGYIH
jgi:cytidylate kinase